MQDNGVKLVDPRGEMLEAAWEGHATVLANAPTTDDLIAALDQIVKNLRIDLSKPSRVVYARDTRPSGPALVSSLEDGFAALNVEARNAGITTTPILHYLVRAINTKGTKDPYGEDTEEGYMQKLSSAFKKLIVSHIRRTIIRPSADRGMSTLSRQGRRPRPRYLSIARTAWALSLHRNSRNTWVTAYQLY